MLEIESTPLVTLEESSQPHNPHGEAPDIAHMSALQIAHIVVAKFPELAKRYQKFIGTAVVVSSAIIVLASFAVNRRLNNGESPEKIIAEITVEEIEYPGKEKPAKPKRRGSGTSH